VGSAFVAAFLASSNGINRGFLQVFVNFGPKARTSCWINLAAIDLYCVRLESGFATNDLIRAPLSSNFARFVTNP
jgi:hypothetical protein